MIGKEELIDKIENTKLERKQDVGERYESKIYLDDDSVLIVGYNQEEEYEDLDSNEERVRNYYWFWELRDSQFDLLYENQDKSYSFCESEIDGWSDNDRVEDVVGDIAEEDVCRWSEQDWIEDISEDIADEVLTWLGNIEKKEPKRN